MASQALPDSVVSHWATLIEGLQASPLQVYQSIEAALLKREVPKIENSRVEYAGGPLSDKRQYLRIKREGLVFDICAAPFGTGFFVSWWQTEVQPRPTPLATILGAVGVLTLLWALLEFFGIVGGLFAMALVVPTALWVVAKMAAEGQVSDAWLKAVPLLGRIYDWLFRQHLYFEHDTTTMFQKAVHNAVMEVIDEQTTAKGLRALSESDRKPVMRELRSSSQGLLANLIATSLLR